MLKKRVKTREEQGGILSRNDINVAFQLAKSSFCGSWPRLHPCSNCVVTLPIYVQPTTLAYQLATLVCQRFKQRRQAKYWQTTGKPKMNEFCRQQRRHFIYQKQGQDVSVKNSTMQPGMHSILYHNQYITIWVILVDVGMALVKAIDLLHHYCRKPKK